MLKKLLLAAICMFLLPSLYSPSLGELSQSPFATVAYAGHVYPGGGYCDCGCPSCICEPGEPRQICDFKMQSPNSPGKVETALVSRGGQSTDTSPEPGAGFLIFAVAFFAWLRFRS